jgi:hypothetical protein
VKGMSPEDYPEWNRFEILADVAQVTIKDVVVVFRPGASRWK